MTLTENKKRTLRPFPRTEIGRLFAARLQSLMGRESTREFARRAGISDRQIRQYLAGDTMPGLDKIHMIADAYGVRAEWLCTGEGPIKPSGDVVAERRTPYICAQTTDERIEQLRTINERLNEALDETGFERGAAGEFLDVINKYNIEKEDLVMLLGGLARIPLRRKDGGASSTVSSAAGDDENGGS